MEIGQLTTFLAVAEERSFTRAADRLGVGQSAVSTMVRRLEDELGIALFDRTTHRVQATDAGLALVPEARRVLEAARGARDAVDAVRGGLRGTVGLGTMQATATGPVSAAALVARFRAEHPDVRVHLQQAASAILAEQVRDGRLDLAILGVPGAPPPGVALTELARVPMVLACRPDHPLAAAGALTLADLTAEQMADFPPRWSVRTTNDDAFAAAGLPRRLAYEVNDTANLVDIVRHGLAVALVARSMVDPGDRSIVLVPLRDQAHAHRISLATPTNRPLGRAAEALRATVVDAAREV